jgi:hypothetical protein
MKLQQAIDRVDEMRPNMQRREIKIAGLSELDGLIWRELIMKHRMTPAEYERYPKDENGRPKMPEYDGDTDAGQTLLVPAPYDNIYLYWLMSKIDEQTMEQEKFNNDRAMFNASWESFSDYWTRNHMPITRIRELMI